MAKNLKRDCDIVRHQLKGWVPNEHITVRDECILCVKDSEKFKTEFTEIIKNSVDKVNKDYKLRRMLGCETQAGKRYSEIH